jgi:DNA-directed RNA polymerase
MAPEMVDAAYDMLDNQHQYKSTEEELMMYREVIAHTGSSCFFPVTLDARGRMYYRGGLMTPQGNDYCKALFQFAKGRQLGDRGEEALVIHLANTLGWDKKSLSDRKMYIYNQHAALMHIKDHVDVREVFPDASPFQATVAIMEYQRMVNSPNRKAFVSTLVCHQDGTCNGLQHMAAITKNRQTAVTVNCVASTEFDNPADVYGIIAEYAFEQTDGEVQELIGRFGRDMAKNPVMITGYGAGRSTIITNTAAYLKAKGANSALAEAIGDAYIAAITANAGAVKALTEALKARVGQAMNKGMERFTWTTADSFVASTEYRDEEVNRIRAGVFNAAVPNMNPTPLDDVKTVGAMSPNFVHSIDATHCRMVINACDHELVTVHDSIGSHAATYFDTAAAIRTTFVEVHQYDALANLCEGMGVRTPQFRGDYDVHEALNSSYIFS